MTSHSREAIVGELRHLYTLENEPEIIKFLDANPTLYDLLREIYPIVQSYLPEENITLEMMYDPEEASYEALFICIETFKSVDEAMDILEKFRQDWWLPHLPQFKNKLGLDLVFL